MTTTPAPLRAATDEPVAYRYKDVRGNWRYVGAPLTQGWAAPENLSFLPLYDTPQSDNEEVPDVCPRCEGSGAIVVPSDNGPDAYNVEVCCPHCEGTGGLLDAYNGVCKLLVKQHADNMRAMAEVWNKARSAPAPVAHRPAVPWIGDPQEPPIEPQCCGGKPDCDVLDYCAGKSESEAFKEWRRRHLDEFGYMPNARDAWQARAAMDVHRPAEGWQPVETAPKDAHVLLWVDIAIGPPLIVQGCWFEISRKEKGWIGGDGEIVNASHWMPMPKAPQGARNEQR